ncbi:PIG-L family deacetylase [Pseudotenacibaculum sp. MALMAid0570]|uniref:PIG-L family deacetylase n=1 Tax=Pseudotenacibaculum sp. MALMAid0570 TaxID=3143938 RepID=UPI0032DFCEF3
MKKNILFVFSFLLISSAIYSQKPNKLNSNQIYEKVQKLNFLGTALYIAAHPDDENTRLISYLANHVKARTAYLSLTRGDGGQNLIGPEIRELLGVIRTQELLAARRVDGGEQRFTRANDFGYSKHPDETLNIWDKKEVLADVVWAIRTFKPDVIINRFDHRTPGTNHGHHTTSAMLSMEAFDLVSDKTKYTEQLDYTDTWQPKRLFFNTSWWFYGSQEKFEKATKDNSDFMSVDVGVYYPLKGLSNNEIASIASSQHLCQGFGRLTTRGSQNEYVEFLKGDKPKDEKDLFAGINTTWNRVKGGGEIGDILYEIEKNFDFVNPSKHLSALMKAYKKIQLLEDSYWRKVKIKQITEIIEACAGLYLEASATSSSAVPNSEIQLNIEALSRNSEVNIILESMSFVTDKMLTVVKEVSLGNNKRQRFQQKLLLPNMDFTDPYWLKNDWSLGMYKVKNQNLIGNPETPRTVRIFFNLNIDEHDISIEKDVIYRYSERDKGELYNPFEILPRITTKLKEKVILFPENKSRTVAVSVQSGANNVKGSLSLDAPKGWAVSPKFIAVSIQQKGDEQTHNFTVTPSSEESEGKLKAIVTINGKKYNKELVEINYSHIPKQSVLLNSEAKVVRLNIEKGGDYIGYIKGAGDAIPESLEQIGYKVKMINPNEINEENLKQFDAVVVGIRAYNTVSALKYKQKFLLDYVKNGGNMIVQYNTSRRVDVGAPYSLQLSRDRVTDENAKVTVLATKHSLMNFPNKISEKDFEGWVQERGLYFPNKWSSEYTPILSMSDKGETPKEGSLLVAKYGKGNYIYTGLSFFRELPAGVPGAYKLFANMLSIGKGNIKQNDKIKQ